MGEEITDETIVETQSAFEGVAAQSGRLFLVVESVHLIDQHLADARAQVFAQSELGWRLRAREKHAQPDQAGGVEDAEKGDLGRFVETVNIVDDEEAPGRCGQAFRRNRRGKEENRPASEGGLCRGRQKMGFAAARRSPEVDRVEVSGTGEGGKARDEFAIGADDEIVETRFGDLKIEQKLLRQGFRGVDPVESPPSGGRENANYRRKSFFLARPSMTHSASLTYRDAGVDIDAGDALVDRIRPAAKRTLRPEVLAGIGGFGALFEIGRKYRNPVLVSGTDGVGTKLKLAFSLDRHDTVGQDLVAMSVNDILVAGAEPLFFLDYFACGRLEVGKAATVIEGIAKACEIAGCSLIGGETAEMPDMYPVGEYDLAGFAVGVVEKENIIDGRRIEPGDVILGLASSGAHSNGYSLIRRILARAKPDLAADFDGRPLADVLLAPTRIYVKPVLALLQALPVKGLAHITGGGLVGNVPRVLPEGVTALIERAAWPWPPLFCWLQEAGGVASEEMYRVFNCGIGMVVIVAPEHARLAAELLAAAGETVHRIGAILPRQAGEPAIRIV